MTGIERLRKLSEDLLPYRLWDVLVAGTEEDWDCHKGDYVTVSDVLSAIADQIEREHNVSDREEHEAAVLVRENGGVDELTRMFQDADNRRVELCGALGIDLDKGWSEAMAAMRLRLMPEGCEWPRYEIGDLVMFGDCVENRNGTCTVNSVRFYSGGGVSVYGEDRGAQFVVVTEPVMRDPIRKARPKVFAADGEPLEVGQTVWDTDAEADTPLTVVVVSSDLVRCEYTWKDGKTYRPCYPPDQLTHTKPEPIDTWQRVEEDAESVAKLFDNLDADASEDVRAIVRRCRALAERERGE